MVVEEAGGGMSTDLEARAKRAEAALREAEMALRDIYTSSNGWIRARAEEALSAIDFALTPSPKEPEA
jgi:Tfp pilus assembly protein PilX